MRHRSLLHRSLLGERARERRPGDCLCESGARPCAALATEASARENGSEKEGAREGEGAPLLPGEGERSEDGAAPRCGPAGGERRLLGVRRRRSGDGERLPPTDGLRLRERRGRRWDVSGDDSPLPPAAPSLASASARSRNQWPSPGSRSRTMWQWWSASVTSSTAAPSPGRAAAAESPRSCAPFCASFCPVASGEVSRWWLSGLEALVDALAAGLLA